MPQILHDPLDLAKEVDKEFLNNYIEFLEPYLSSDSINKLKEYFTIGKDEKTSKELWKSLIIDSISLLKINDARENLFAHSISIHKEKLINDISGLHENYNNLRQFNCYGIEDLERYFNDFVHFESVLYGSDKNYRDHVNHVISVWAIGIIFLFKYNLIEGISLNDKAVASKYKYSFLDPAIRDSEKCKVSNTRKHTINIAKGELVSIWTMIALCHDLGYPIEKASKINEKLKTIIGHFGQINIDEFNYNFSILSSFLVEKFLNIISSKPDIKTRHTRIQEKYRDKLSKGLEDFRHGIFSSLLLYKSLTYFLETDYSYDGDDLSYEDLRQFYIRKEILRSIAAHTSPKLYHLNIKNLAFLLFISDELNEWGRPNFEDFKSPGTRKSSPSVLINDYTLSKDHDKLDVEFVYKSIENDEIIEPNIKRKFRIFYHLLRTAKDDKNRKFEFIWTLTFKIKNSKKVIKYCFVFNSEQSPDKIIDVKKWENKKYSDLDILNDTK